MKRMLLMFLAVFFLLLCGCDEPHSEDRILVMIEETPGCTVEKNGLWVVPGEDAVFTLQMERGFALASTDYKGSYHTESVDQTVTLTLENIVYPTRLHLSLTCRYCTINYIANGGHSLDSLDLTYTNTYDLSQHPRPNTDIGTDRFARDGHTLVGWNTKSDGTGQQVGLGSRVTVPDGYLTLYAQWAKWSDVVNFDFTVGETVTITRYRGNETIVVIPEIIQGKEVTAVASGAFQNCSAEAVIFPQTMDIIEERAFQNCALTTLIIFDNIQAVSDLSFFDCPNLQTLRINAIEAPYGYIYRKESCYADKVDLLILAQGQEKLVFYGGCSVWYNLEGSQVYNTLGDVYAIINLGLNGTVNSQVQMQILGAFLEEGDILFHSPELSSKQQLLINQDMGEDDDKLWCGIENNYDLFSLVDLQTINGVFDSLCTYLSMKNGKCNYQQYYLDDYDRAYMDNLGCIPFARTNTEKTLGDRVYLNPDYIDSNAMARLKSYYDWFLKKGVHIYVSYACVNMDAVPEEQRENVKLIDTLFRQSIEVMDGPVLISNLEDYLFHTNDFFDTNYHLRSQTAHENTALWLRDLLAQMEKDGLRETS